MPLITNILQWLQYPGNTSGSFTTAVFFLSISSYFALRFRFGDISHYKTALIHLIRSYLLVILIVALYMYVLRVEYFSRIVLIGTIFLSVFVELIQGTMSRNSLQAYNNPFVSNKPRGGGGFFQENPLVKVPTKKRAVVPSKLKTEIIETSGLEVFNFLLKNLDLKNKSTELLRSNDFNDVKQLHFTNTDQYIKLKRINDIRYLNKYIEEVNAKLKKGGFFAGCVETKNQRKKRILNKFPKGFNRIYYFLDFILKRVFPKFSVTKKIYFKITKGNNRVLSSTETFGRLYSCGFEVLDEKEINGYLHFIARKKSKPYYDKQPTYGPIIRLRRIGKNNKIINVYKMRTMHPYAEYLQEYVYKKSELNEGGKFKNDFRITTEGRLFRKYWIDELPMLINLIKGDLKLFGVRPLSKHYFSLYTPELRRKRTLTKPGLIPPFYADLPKTLDEIQQSELNYLNSYFENPVLTDWKYFWKAFNNIVFRNARSN